MTESAPGADTERPVTNTDPLQNAGPLCTTVDHFGDGASRSLFGTARYRDRILKRQRLEMSCLLRRLTTGRSRVGTVEAAAE
jgi:hypothetical protein